MSFQEGRPLPQRDITCDFSRVFRSDIPVMFRDAVSLTDRRNDTLQRRNLFTFEAMELCAEQLMSKYGEAAPSKISEHFDIDYSAMTNYAALEGVPLATVITYLSKRSLQPGTIRPTKTIGLYGLNPENGRSYGIELTRYRVVGEKLAYYDVYKVTEGRDFSGQVTSQNVIDGNLFRETASYKISLGMPFSEEEEPFEVELAKVLKLPVNV